MTVGIYTSNGKKAIVMMDVRSSQGARTSDSLEKGVGFRNKKAGYQGVIFGAGPAVIFSSAIDYIRNNPAGTVDELVAGVSNHMSGQLDAFTIRRVDRLTRDLAAEGSLYEKLPFGAELLKERLGKGLATIDQLDGSPENPFNQTQLCLAVYDPSQNVVRPFVLGGTGHFIPYNQPNIQIGSGMDASNFYLATKCSGISFRGLSAADLLFHSANAYALAGTNQGVGGTPEVYVVGALPSEENLGDQSSIKLAPLTGPHRTLLLNLAGAHLSGFAPDALSVPKTRELVESLLKGDVSFLNDVAGALDVTPDTLTTMPIAAATWQARANVKLYGAGNGSEVVEHEMPNAPSEDAANDRPSDT